MRTPLLTAALIAVVSLPLLPAWAGAQIIIGKVVDNNDETPIGQAEVVLVDAKGNARVRMLTDTLGAFRLDAPAQGQYTLAVRRLGYEAVATPVVEVEGGEAVVVEVRMSAAAILLDPLVVVERRRYGGLALQQFYERAEWVRKTGNGRIYFREDLNLVGSVRSIYLLNSRPRGCPMTVLVDNLPVDRPEDLDFIASLDRVEGVELYRSAVQIPQEFSHLARCALMLVWTRPVEGRPLTLKRLLVMLGVFGSMFFIL